MPDTGLGSTNPVKHFSIGKQGPIIPQAKKPTKDNPQPNHAPHPFSKAENDYVLGPADLTTIPDAEETDTEKPYPTFPAYPKDTVNRAQSSTLYSADPPPTSEPLRVANVDMHRHFGRLDDHPVGVRHRKTSADPLHKQEDSLYDEFKDLRDKAKQGSCNSMEIARLREIQGQLSAIQHQRISNARELVNGASSPEDMPHDTIEESSTPSAAAIAAKPAEASEAPMDSDTAPPMHAYRPTSPEARENYIPGRVLHPHPAHGSPSTPQQRGMYNYHDPYSQRHADEVSPIRAPMNKEANETGAPMNNPTASIYDVTKTSPVIDHQTGTNALRSISASRNPDNTAAHRLLTPPKPIPLS